MIRITAKHFVAGVVLAPAPGFDGLVAVRCAPIVQYMLGWPRELCIEAAALRGVQISPPCGVLTGFCLF
jgi:hypothetical protein